MDAVRRLLVKCGAQDLDGHKCERDYEASSIYDGAPLKHLGPHRDKGYWWTGKNWHRTTKIGSAVSAYEDGPGVPIPTT